MKVKKMIKSADDLRLTEEVNKQNRAEIAALDALRQTRKPETSVNMKASAVFSEAVMSDYINKVGVHNSGDNVGGGESAQDENRNNVDDV